MRLGSCVLAGLVSASLLSACAMEGDEFGLDDEAVASDESAVIDGRNENKFPAVGYLEFGNGRNGPLGGASCGATLIAPDVAVTAAHCVEPAEDFHFAVGFGKVGSSPVIDVKKVFVHPDHDGNAFPGREKHDLAVLILKKRPNIQPMEIGITQVGDEVRYVGYGRTVAGDVNTSRGGGVRKSARQEITRLSGTNIFTTGIDGGLCFGDSGGPIVDDDNPRLIYGVLGDFDGVFRCERGNKMIFTKLDAERGFINRAIACRNSNDPDCPNR